MKTIKRDDSNYLEIENFEEFEYTNNVLYELFKRSLIDEDDSIENHLLEKIDNKKLILKDVVLYDTVNGKLTLDEVVYNIYPELYDEDVIRNNIGFDYSLMPVNEFLNKTDGMDYNDFVYKDLSSNSYKKFTEIGLEELLERVSLHKKITIQHKKKQLNLEQNNFIDIYNLNLALPDNELLHYIKKLKKLHFKDNLLTDKRKYLSYIYNNKKLADILYVYDKVKSKRLSIKSDVTMRKIQFDLLYYRRESISILDSEDFTKCKISKENEEPINKNLEKLFYLLKGFDAHATLDDLELLEMEDVQEIKDTIDEIYSLIDDKYKNKFIKYLPFVSLKTIYNYLNIAKYYIDEKNYTSLLN